MTQLTNIAYAYTHLLFMWVL